jgi:hypothetical protein
MALSRTVFGLVFALGCGTTVTATQINSPPHALYARPSASVEMFSSGPPERPHVDIALVQATLDSGFSTDDDAVLLAKLRERAAVMGCDALVVGGPIASRRHGYFGTCIAYTR